ncbi:MAG: DHA2 family efflux MFS transporter permease subunit [Candidatus Dormiibacterota bacterium]
MSSELPRRRALTLDSAAGRWVLAATVLGSGMAFLDSTVVTVALPAIGRQLGGGLPLLQWVVDAYLLTLGALVLTGGALADLFGRDRVFVIGAAAFGVTSAACGAAPSGIVLIVARLAQGIAASLLVPTSLAVVVTSFVTEERGRAIGIWSGMSGLSTVVGPLLGGLLVDHANWRWVFLINLPLALATVLITLRHLPTHEVSARSAGQRVDTAGTATSVAGLGLLVYGLIQGPQAGTNRVVALGAIVAGVALLVAFGIIEAREEHPMLPLALFAIRDFTVANLTTLVVYAALSAALLLVVLELQEVAGYSALASGAALFPITLLLLAISPRMGGAVGRVGPRRLMTAGPALAAIGLLLFLRVSGSAPYLTAVLPAALVFGLGLSITVAPLTTTVLGSVPSIRAGVASGMNNAVARIAGLLAVAVIPLAAGLASGGSGGAAFTAGFHRAMVISAALCVIGALVSLVGLRPRQGAAARA